MLTVPGREAGYYPLRGDLIGALYVHQVPRPDLPADPKATLHGRYGDLGWIVPDALARCPDPPELYYDQVAQVELPCWSSRRTTLLGDACQAVSLLAGQGASLAMGGAYVLATEVGAGPDVSEALVRYETRMRPIAEREQAAGRRVAEWFLPTTSRRIVARDLVLRTVALPGVRRLLRPVLTPATTSVVPRGERSPTPVGLAGGGSTAEGLHATSKREAGRGPECAARPIPRCPTSSADVARRPRG
jgi:2-polyprenyl-6-methoxyphenol hydroxylase-like FAD-dependent oxidoreductase